MPILLTRNCLIIIFFSFIQIRLICQENHDRRISRNLDGIPMISALNMLENEHAVKFYYKKEWFVHDTVHVNLENKTIDEAIRMILNGKPFTFRIIQQNHVVILPRDEVDMLTGQLSNYSDNELTDKSFVMVGSLDDAGRMKTATVSGRITDGKTDEPIIGAVVQVNNMQKGDVTDLQGNYKLSLTPGLYTLIISSVGYEQNTYHVKLLSNGVLNMELFDKSIALEDVVIYGQRLDRNVSSFQMSMVDLDVRNIKQLPTVAGGKDILKGLTAMPGVKSVGEFSSGINVRGGGEDQNLYLFNGAPLFNTSHVFGLISVINPDAVERLVLYKGHIPAFFGERVSSVIDIHTGESAPARIRLKGGVGLYDGKLMAEVPLYRDKIFFDIGGRANYSNWILHKIKDPDLQNSAASFYDFNGTLHVVLPKGHISLSGYTCYDEFRFASEVKYAYGSTMGSLNWNYLLGSNLSSNLSLSYSKYNVAKDDISTRMMESRTESGITYSGLKYRMKYGGIQHHTLDAGISLTKYELQPGNQFALNNESLVTPQTLTPEHAYEGAVFLNEEFTPNEFFTLNAGMRISGYRYQNTDLIFGFEPRLSAKFQLNYHSSIKASYNRNYQYLSLISYSSVSTPSDIWKLSDTEIRPLLANQFALGYYHNLLNNSIEASIELYYKGLANVIEYKDGAKLEMNGNIGNELINAQGRNYGVEFLIKKNTGKVDGWISYTYSRSIRRTQGSNSGEMINRNSWFPSSYDKPHDFTIITNYHVNKRVQISANFTFSTGRPITLPEYKYFVGNEAVVYFSDKNKYRIPPYHRLDLSFSVDESLYLKKKWKGRWSFSLLNVYGRKNAYTVYYKKENPSQLNDFKQFSMYKLYLIGRPVPVISYSFIF